MITIAIDPGYAARGPGCAVAIFDGPHLASVGYQRPGPHIVPVPGCVAVYEIPMVRPREDVSPGKACTLIRLAATGAELAGRYGGAVVSVEPAAWKGATPKPISHGRIWAALGLGERGCVLPEQDVERHIDVAKRAGGLARWAREGDYYYGTWKGHNILDAIGIGLHYLGRDIV